MEATFSNRLRTTFIVHAFVATLLGGALWLIPGRFLTLLGWVDEFVQLPESTMSVPGSTFVDPVITRLLGAALLALAYSSFQAWRAQSWEQVALLVKSETVFCALGVAAFLVVIINGDRELGWAVWLMLALLAGFMVAWGWAWSRKS
jgi:hypothetical protein